MRPRVNFNPRALGVTVASLLVFAMAAVLMDTFGMSPYGAVLIAAVVRAGPLPPNPHQSGGLGLRTPPNSNRSHQDARGPHGTPPGTQRPVTWRDNREP